MPNLDPRTLAMLNTEHGDEVYMSVLTTGDYAVLNLSDAAVSVNVPGIEKALVVEPYGSAMAP